MRLSSGIGFVAVAATLIASLFGEWTVARLAGGSAVIPPLTTLATVIVIQVLPFSASIGYAAAAGFLVDSVALPPFGATITLFIFLACVREVMRVVMADHKSYAAKIAMTAGLCVIAYGATPWARGVAAALRDIIPV